MNEEASEFANEARRFSELMEVAQSSDERQFAIDCLRSVLHLCGQALILPSTELPTGVSIPERLGYETWKSIRSKIGEKLPRDHYWQVFEPFEIEQPELLSGSLSDDLADIWCELNVGLHALDAHTENGTKQALWHWRFSFEIHWSRHAASAITALNALCFGEFAESAER